ncbi:MULTISPECIES: hypothetical protein [Pseudomonas syringae group]|uniref:hypothetical protein n=1 Tax=Pseudomonas syringae group TaxID=136849 RepID=UPI000F023ECA|nr:MULTISPECIES: hypothetical protein [Pseudomonas syringae group]MCF5244210.1 hypothetical protein [Pseudomonas syringae]
MNNLKLLLTVVLCGSSIISCFCWGKSALAKVPAKNPGSIIVWADEAGFETDLAATVKSQTKWNKIAAGSASVAAIAQGVLAAITW